MEKADLWLGNSGGKVVGVDKNVGIRDVVGDGVGVGHSDACDTTVMREIGTMESNHVYPKQ